MKHVKHHTTTRHIGSNSKLTHKIRATAFEAWLGVEDANRGSGLSVVALGRQDPCPVVKSKLKRSDEEGQNFEVTKMGKICDL